MIQKLKVFLAVVCVGLVVGACGVEIVRPVDLNTHKRPTFRMANINRVAVLEASGKSSAAADIMSLRLLDHGFNVIERARIKEVLKEHSIKLSHDEDIKEAKRIGEMLEADSIMIISVSDYTSSQQMIQGGCASPHRIETVVALGMTARLVDVNTSEVIWVGAASTQDRNMQACITRISDQLIKSIQSQ